jgi:hypothetical protein
MGWVLHGQPWMDKAVLDWTGAIGRGMARTDPGRTDEAVVERRGETRRGWDGDGLDGLGQAEEDGPVRGWIGRHWTDQERDGRTRP